ncbi:MAG: hypothetical protein HQM06_12450 [Magnetococcales bacterium]|nr:hypothetical protein [Magnetococcales bacterium]
MANFMLLFSRTRLLTATLLLLLLLLFTPTSPQLLPLLTAFALLPSNSLATCCSINPPCANRRNCW